MRRIVLINVDTWVHLRGGGGQWRCNHPLTNVCYEMVLCDNRRWNWRVFSNKEYGKGVYKRLQDAVYALWDATGRGDWRCSCK